MFGKLDKVLISFLGGIIVFLVVLTSVQVVMRYVFDSPLTWAEEFIGVTMIYFGLIGSAWGIRHGIHIALEVFVQKLMKGSEKFVDWLEVISYVAVGVFEIIYGSEIVNLTKYQVLPATGIKVSYTYLAIPIAGSVMLLFSIEKILKILKR